MTSRDELKKKVIAKLNKEYGTTLLNIDICCKLKDQYEDGIKQIKAELNLSNADSSITETIVGAKDIITEINKFTKEVETVAANVSVHLQETKDKKSKLEDYFLQLNKLEYTLQYLKIVTTVENLSEELQLEIEKGDDEQCVTIFANLSEIARQIAVSSIVHLKSYIKEAAIYWHNILKDKFAKDFNDALKTIKWPFVNTNFTLEIPLEPNINKLQIVVEYLLQIDLPEELVLPSQTSFKSDFPHLSLPVQLLVEPLRKRFLFHFYGNRKTNRSDKPEWYFTKILSWIRDHSEFVEKWIQPVMDKIGLYYINAKVELMRGLVQLGVEKLYSDLPSLQFDDFTFSHCIDEALGFDKELKESYDYPVSQPGVLVVLTQAQVFIKWMSMEKKYALEKMDAMLSESLTDAFQPIDSDGEGLKIAPCAEIFITLLQTITERYEVLLQPGHRLQFLELQLELLDDFRVRLLQLVRAEEGDIIDSRVPVIANTIFYIENVLVDWGAMLHFLNLYYYKSQLENRESNKLSISDDEGSPVSEIDTDTVFAETLSLYRHMRKDLLMSLAESVVAKAKAYSRSYRHELWSQIKNPQDIRSLSLTPSACPMFETLGTRLHQLQKHLTEKLFTITWRSIAQQIDAFLFEELVLENRFSQGGALQFKYDITRNLFPLFSQYTDRPDSYFTRVIESCALLNISKGSALLLRETLIALDGATGVEDRRGQALKEVGVQALDPSMAVTILNRRVDLNINTFVVD